MVVYSCVWIDIYNGGSLVFCACVYLQTEILYPKNQTIFTPKHCIYTKISGKQNFLYGYMQNDLENQNPKSRLHCAICKYHLEN